MAFETFKILCSILAAYISRINILVFSELKIKFKTLQISYENFFLFLPTHWLTYIVQMMLQQHRFAWIHLPVDFFVDNTYYRISWEVLWWLTWSIMAYKTGDPGLIPGSGRSPGEKNGNSLQYSCLEGSMDRGAWWGQSMGSQRVRHDWATNTHFTSQYFMTWGCLKLPLIWKFE